MLSFFVSSKIIYLTYYRLFSTFGRLEMLSKILKYPFVTVILVMMLSVDAWGQLPAKQQNYAGFRKEFYAGASIHTQGWGGSLYYSKFTTANVKRLYTLDLVSMKHPKEFKRFGSVDENAKGFVFGKLNSFYVLRPGIGKKKILFEKIREQGVQLSFNWSAGPSIGMTKPEYLEILKVSNGQVVGPFVEKYDPEEHNLSNIYGRGPASRGLSELKFHPGAFLKMGLNFEYSTEHEGIRSIEVGGTLDGYPWRIPIMTSTQNHFLYGTLYVNLLFGKKYI